MHHINFPQPMHKSRPFSSGYCCSNKKVEEERFELPNRKELIYSQSQLAIVAVPPDFSERVMGFEPMTNSLEG